MINLKPLIDSDVHIFFKHAIYVMGVLNGNFVPLSPPPKDGNSGGPMISDRLEGRLRCDDGQYILTYANPLNPGEQIDYYFDAEDICGVWAQRKISIVSAATVLKP